MLCRQLLLIVSLTRNPPLRWNLSMTGNLRCFELYRTHVKLPRTFQISTPVGNYAPDWAIAMKKNDVKHIFFVAETKGSMSSMDLSAIERAKIDCAEKLFNSISTANVKYHKVATYQDLIDGMNAIG